MSSSKRQTSELPIRAPSLTRATQSCPKLHALMQISAHASTVRVEQRLIYDTVKGKNRGGGGQGVFGCFSTIVHVEQSIMRTFCAISQNSQPMKSFQHTILLRVPQQLQRCAVRRQYRHKPLRETVLLSASRILLCN